MSTLRHFLRDDDLTPAEQAEVLALAAAAVAGERDGVGLPAAAGEPGQEVFFPAPRRDVGAVDEEQGMFMGGALGCVAQHLEFAEAGCVHAGSLSRAFTAATRAACKA